MLFSAYILYIEGDQIVHHTGASTLFGACSGATLALCPLSVTTDGHDMSASEDRPPNLERFCREKV